MSNFIEPAKDMVLVIDVPQETVLGDIVMPDNVRQQEMFSGVVISVGPLALQTKPKDRVLYGPYAGKTMVLDGMQYRGLREGQIEFYLREKTTEGVI